MPNGLAGLLLLVLLTALVVGFLVDSEARGIARRREEPPPAKLPKRQSVEERRAALSRPPRRVRTTAVRPRIPDIDETDDETDDEQSGDAQSDAPQEMPPARLTNQIVALVGILAFGVVLFLGCAALSYVYDNVADGDKYRRPTAGELFIAALERGDAAEVNRLWRGGAIPSYDLTDCLDVNRQTTISSSGGKSNMTIRTRVTYATACAVGPHDEPLNSIYVLGSTGSVYYIGHTPR